MKHLRKVLSLMLALLFMLSLAVTAFAETYVIDDGSITISADSSGTTVTQANNGDTPRKDNSPVITGSGQTSNTISISADFGYTASVTLKDVNINTGDAAVIVWGRGNVILELDGTNTVTSGDHRAGVEKTRNGSLTITDDSGTAGSLTANGGVYGAGIGSCDYDYYPVDSGVSNITISGGTVTANGGLGAAGIGGGYQGKASDITISGGTVTAQGGYGGAGIGGGHIFGNADTITISGGKVYAAGGGSGAGIGGGQYGKASNITISGDAQIHVAGGSEDSFCGAGAAIGNGGKNDGGSPVNGAEVEPDTDGLTSGSVTTYPAGTSTDDMKPKPTPTDAGDPFLGFCLAVAEKIKAAPENGTLEINAGRYTGFASFVLEALAQRPDLTLTVTWKQGGADQTLTIPAGTDLTSLSGNTILFTDIAGLVG